MTKAKFMPSCVVTTMTNLSSSHLKSRRNRTSFTRYQLEEMERVFSQTHYPDSNIRQVMSEKLDLAEAKIQVNMQGIPEKLCSSDLIKRFQRCGVFGAQAPPRFCNIPGVPKMMYQRLPQCSILNHRSI